MSHNLIGGRFLTAEDDDFVLKVDRDIRSYYLESSKNSVLLFPPVNSYYRFLIHKVCNSLANELSNSGLTTFSIGLGDHRRTIVCYTNQLLIYPTSSSHKSSEAEFNWLYVARNSVPKYTATNDVTKDDKHRVNRSNTEIMGIENVDAIVTHQTTEEKDNLCFKTEKSSLSEDLINAKKSSRRRPERAFYVPRAKRSQTCSSATSSSSLKSHNNKKKSEKSKSIDESTSSTSNSEESNDTDSLPAPSLKQHQNQFFDCTVINSNLHSQSSSTNCCDLFNQNSSEPNSFASQDLKDQKNHNNYCTMSSLQTEKELIIANETSDGSCKIDKDEKELMKASQEINRSNRKLIKQTFNSNVLEIETASGTSESKNDDKAVNKEDDDWDSLFDDNGDCLDPKMVEEITKAVGKVQIEKPKSDYRAYHANVELLKDQEYPHVLECSNFPVEFRTQDLMNLFGPFARDSGFNIIWVDDTHCLVVFSSSKIAAEVLSANHPIVKVKPLNEATSESRTKARKCSSSLQPYRQRPETCAALAKRLVSGALGVRIKATSEERENERRVLREAKERKLLAAKAREEMWNN